MYVDMDFVDEDDDYDDYGSLRSHLLTATDPSGWCISFWYHMYGDDVNKLSAYSEVRDIAGDTLWSRTGSQGPVWRYGQVNFSVIMI